MDHPSLRDHHVHLPTLPTGPCEMKGQPRVPRQSFMGMVVMDHLKWDDQNCASQDAKDLDSR